MPPTLPRRYWGNFSGVNVVQKQLEAYREQFRDYKMTPQRRLILQTLLENQEQHLSAEELFALLKEKDREIGLATVYRTLELMEALNIVHKLNFGDGRSRYELCQPQAEHQHHHLVCLQCGRILEVKEDLLHQLETLIEKEHGFQILDHRVSFYGYCSECRKSKATGEDNDE
ncbi:MAG TPA: transcriptional repressor [Firmicutes bacterium]|nr:transcriptional repressor [Bacillota bacterium]